MSGYINLSPSVSSSARRPLWPDYVILAVAVPFGTIDVSPVLSKASTKLLTVITPSGACVAPTPKVELAGVVKSA